MVVRRTQVVVRSSGFLFLVIGLAVAAWISHCLFEKAQLGIMLESGEWTGVLAKAVSLAIAMMAFGGRVLADGHRPMRRLSRNDVSMVTPELVYQVRKLAQRGQLNDAVRIYRSSTGQNRRDSIDAVRRLTR
ncbi:MAG: hypothetical protein ACYTGG_09225 [Planctomycetota bacterium]|jgi:hypothetical protein